MRALVGKRDWLGKGSKIILTTRKKDILNVPEVDHSYEVNAMDLNQSLQLFSKHAFGEDYPLDEYIIQSKKAIKIAGGLPLALEVIGSLLSSKNKEMWDATLKKLANVPHVDVQGKLKISYDALDDEEKDIFLDIACLFIGYDKDILIHFWDAPKLSPKVAMEVLQNMSLIKIKKNNIVWMHDQLRDLGRMLVSKKNIEEQSRVWDPKEALDLLRRHKGNKVEALRLKLHHKMHYRFTYEGYESLSNLRFLEVDNWMENFHAEERLLWPESSSNVLPTNDFQENSNLLPHLRWLSWRDIPPTFNITNFSMEDVVILDLSKSEITDDWKGWSHMKVMRNLKVLDLSSCRNLQRLPDEVGRDLASLEYLSLKGCKQLERLPDSIGNLESLIKLDISRTRIANLPESIGKLKNLKKVKMWNCGISEIPDAFWTIEKLEEIRACNKRYGSEGFHVKIGNGISKNQSLRILRLVKAKIYALPSRLPESLIHLKLSNMSMDTFPDLSNLTNLKELDLSFSGSYDNKECNGLVEDWISRWIGNLSKLESLCLDSHQVTTVPLDISLLPQLEFLSLSCPNLRHLPKLPSSLSILWLDNCSSLCSMEDLSNLKNLSSLFILNAAIAEIPGLGCLENLRDLQLWGLGQVETLRGLPSSLSFLELYNCSSLCSIEDLSNLENLRDLHLFSLGQVETLRGLPSSLSKLRLYNCSSLCSMEDLSNLKNLSSLQIEYAAIAEIPGLDRLENLRDLNLRSLGQVKTLRGLPSSLSSLELSYCKSLCSMEDLSNLKNLSSLSISRATIAEIPGLGCLENLRHLELWRLQQVKTLRELPSSLSSLRLYNCSSLCSMEDLSNLKNLSSLKIKDAAIAEIPGLGCLENLQDLELRSLGQVEELRGLPSSLSSLWLYNCSSLCSMEDLSNLKNLSFLSISNLGQVEILPGNLNKLRSLHISHCGNLVEIQGELPQSLEELSISSCESLQELPNLSSLKGLRKVEINGCGKLNVEAISSLCLEKSVEFVGEVDGNLWEKSMNLRDEIESESEEEDDEFEYESEGEDEE